MKNTLSLLLFSSFLLVVRANAASWTGYVVTTGVDTATSVECVITIPTLPATGVNASVDAWVGIGGFPIDGKQYLALQQIGFQCDEQTNDTTGQPAQYNWMWTEMYPKGPVFKPESGPGTYDADYAFAGQRVRLRVDYGGRGRFTLTSLNLDTGEVYTVNGRSNSASRGTVEFIVEGTLSFIPPPPWSITFSECRYAVNGVWYPLTSAQWVNQLGLPFATLSNQTFTITRN